MRRCRLVDARVADALPHGALEHLVLDVMPTDDAVARIAREPLGRKDILPAPFARRVRILARQRERQPDGAESLVEVLLMQLDDVQPMLAQRPDDRARHHGDAIFLPLPFRTSISRRESSTSRTRRRSASFLWREYDRQPAWPLGANYVIEPGRLYAEHFAVEEQNRGLRLVLSRCGDVAIKRQSGGTPNSE